MLKHKTDLKERDIDSSKRNIDVHFLDDGAAIFLELPSAQELLSLNEGYKAKFSITSLAQKDTLNLVIRWRHELERLQSKYDRFKHSSNYLVNLASLADMVGENALAAEYLEAASQLDDSRYIKNEIGNSLLKQKKFSDAENFFNHINIDDDLYPKLRLAFFSVLNNDIPKSKGFIEAALAFSPDNYEANLFYGTLCLWAGELEKAIRSFRIAI